MLTYKQEVSIAYYGISGAVMKRFPDLTEGYITDKCIQSHTKIQGKYICIQLRCINDIPLGFAK